MKNCQRCRLCATRTQVVGGRGPTNVDIMLVGEAPGDTEDRMGRPFVGRSGQLLDKLLTELGLINDVYITNAVKCRPPANRRPRQDEIDSCSSWLADEMADKHQIVTLGRTAQLSVAERQWDWGTDHIIYIAGGRHVSCRAVWHPSFILRNPQLYAEWKAQWNSLKP